MLLKCHLWHETTSLNWWVKMKQYQMLTRWKWKVALGHRNSNLVHLTFSFINEVQMGARVFYQGLFWHCWFQAQSDEFSVLDLWNSKEPSRRVFTFCCGFYWMNWVFMCFCPSSQSGALQFFFSFPISCHRATGMSAGVTGISSRAVGTPLCHWLVSFPTVSSFVFPNLHCDLHNLVFRTFWSIFLVTALTSIPIGSLVVVCACPLSKPTLFKVGGAFQLCGGKAHFLVSHNSV